MVRPAPITGAVVLAAGAGTRVGGPKALLRWGATTFAGHCARALAAGGVGAIVVVHGSRVDPAALDLPAGCATLENPCPQDGPWSSLVLGAAELHGVDGVLVLPVDHPALRPMTVALLLDAARGDSRVAWVPRHGDRGGHPPWVPAAWLARRPAPEHGLREVLRARPADVRAVFVDDPAVVDDVDNPDDLARLLAQPAPYWADVA